jgi:hypothetical protein
MTHSPVLPGSHRHGTGVVLRCNRRAHARQWLGNLTSEGRVVAASQYFQLQYYCQRYSNSHAGDTCHRGYSDVRWAGEDVFRFWDSLSRSKEKNSAVPAPLAIEFASWQARLNTVALPAVSSIAHIRCIAMFASINQMYVHLSRMYVCAR